MLWSCQLVTEFGRKFWEPRYATRIKKLINRIVATWPWRVMVGVRKWKLICKVSSSVGGRPERPPFEIGKIVVENWCYFQDVYTLGEGAEIPEIFRKRFGNKSIFHRDFYQIISKFPLFLDQTRKILQAGFCILAVYGNYSSAIALLVILNVSTNFSLFSPKFSRIFIPLQIVFLGSQPIMLRFW